MTHLGERGQRRTAYALGRRIAADQFRMLRFEFLEFAEQPVVFGVRDTGLVEDVVAVVVQVEFGAKFEDTGLRGGHGRWSLVKQKSSRGCSLCFFTLSLW
ncbi:hypothetical protein D3C81_2017100 [compost metagenome]